MPVVTTAAGRRIHYVDRGVGQPVLMLSGTGSSKEGWDDTVKRLSPRYRCLAIDNRDAGENDPETSPYSIADLAGDAAAFLRAMGIDRAHVIGSSMGGFIALQLALCHPQLVDRLVPVGTAAVSHSDIPVPARENWIEDTLERARMRLPYACAPGYFDAHPERLEQMAAQTRVNRLTYEGYVRQLTAGHTTHDVRARLGEISHPALVVHGNADRALPLALGEELAAGLPNARLAILPGVGHLPHRENPDRFAAVVQEFFAEQ